MRGWSAMLWAAAAYNLLVGLPGLVMGTTVTDRIVSLLVACFGLIYGLTARDPRRFAPVLWAGVVGKLGVVALMLPSVQAGTAVPGTGWILLGDAAFTALFVVFLLGPARKQPFRAH
jgi:hypothetical protein